MRAGHSRSNPLPRRMTKPAPTTALLAVALLTLPACAVIRKSTSASSERDLAAAGFQMRPERDRDLATMPPRKLLSRRLDGTVVYMYADPDECHCLYIGGPGQYSEYKRRSAERQRAIDRTVALD